MVKAKCYGHDIEQCKKDWEYRMISWSCKINKVSIDLILKVIFDQRHEESVKEGDLDIGAKFFPGREYSNKMSLTKEHT